MKKSILLFCVLLAGWVLRADDSAAATNAAPVSGAAPTSTMITPDDPGSVQRGINAAYQAGLHQVVIPPGIYRLAPLPKINVCLLLAKFHDFTVEATGVTFILTAPDAHGIRLDDCTKVTINGATLIHDPIPFSQGHIVSVADDHRTVDIQVSKGYPTNFDDPHRFDFNAVNLFDPATRHWRGEDYAKAPIERLGPDTFRFHGGSLLTPEHGWVAGGAVAWRGVVSADVEIRNGSKLRLTGLTIENAAGFVVFEHSGAGDNYYNYTLTYGPKPEGATEEPLMSSNADGFHSAEVRHGPTLEDCHLEGMNDDGVPIHGTFALGVSATGTTAIINIGRPPFCRPGDHLSFLDERAVPMAEAVVTAMQPLPGFTTDQTPSKFLKKWPALKPAGYLQLTLDRAVPLKFGWMVSNLDAEGSNFVVRRCTVRYNRARGMLLQASNGLIEDCTLEGCSAAGIAICPQLTSWNQSDWSQNIVVRHNTFRHVDEGQFPGSGQSGALTIVGNEYGNFVPLPGGHKHFVIEDNTFEDDDGPNILLTSAQDVVLRNNHFVHPLWRTNTHGTAYGIDTNALIWMTECSGVTISGNVVVDPGPNLKTLIVHSPTVSGTGLDDGVAVQK